MFNNYVLHYLLQHDRLPIFQLLKMFKLLHQSNNIVETTQLTNDQMPEFHCQCQ